MIRQQTKFNIADNSGAKKAQCFHIPGGTRKKYARPGDIVIAAVKEAKAGGATVKQHEIVRVVIVRTTKEIRRSDGSYLSFNDNAGVIINKEGQPVGTRVLGPIAREATKTCTALTSLANEIF